MKILLIVLICWAVFGVCYALFALVTQKSRTMAWYDWILIGPLCYLVLLVLWISKLFRKRN